MAKRLVAQLLVERRAAPRRGAATSSARARRSARPPAARGSPRPRRSRSAVGHGAVHHPPRRGLRARDDPAEQQHLAGAHLADPARQQPVAPLSGVKPALGERFPQPGVVGDDRRSRPPARAAGRSRPPTLGRRRPPAPGRTAATGSAGGPGRAAVAGCSRPAAGRFGRHVAAPRCRSRCRSGRPRAGDDDGAHRLVAAGRFDGGDEGGDHVVGQRVPLVRTGQPEPEDAVGQRDVEPVGTASYTISSPREPGRHRRPGAPCRSPARPGGSGQPDRPVLAARAAARSRGPAWSPPALVGRPAARVDRRTVAVGQVAPDHRAVEPLRVADVVERRNSQPSFHSQASSPIQSVQRWISHVSRIRP